MKFLDSRLRGNDGKLLPWNFASAAIINYHGPVKFKKAVTPDESRQANYEL
jgi:hypothetical protein